MKTTIIRNIPDELHREFKAAIALADDSLNATIIRLMNLQTIIGTPRDAAMEGIDFRLEPHRTDDSKDSPDVWVWKLRTYVNGKNTKSQLL